MTRYYQTDAGYGATDDDTFEFPESWTEITKDQYDALIAAEEQAAADVEAAARAASSSRWSTVHDELVRIGMSDEAAVLLANAVGIRPA
jgi:hypothetical protein